MASTRTRRWSRGRPGKTKAELRKLLRKAEAEVRSVLRGDQAGTLTRTKMRARLLEVREVLHAMEPLESWQR